MPEVYEYLKGLAEDPEKFNEAAAQLIEDFINGLPEEKQQVYRAKQWRLEQELSKFKDPVARMNKMVELFWDGVNEGVDEYRRLGFLK